MPKIAAKSGEIINATTFPVDKMNLDRSPLIHCPFFVKGFFSFILGLEDENRHNRFLMIHLGERNLSLLRKKTSLNHFVRIA